MIPILAALACISVVVALLSKPVQQCEVKTLCTAFYELNATATKRGVNRSIVLDFMTAAANLRDANDAEALKAPKRKFAITIRQEAIY